MAKPYKYRGILGETPRHHPIELAAALDPDNMELRERARQHDPFEFGTQFLTLLQALLEDCGQPPMTDPKLVRWDIVALKLAWRHIPAFGPIEIPDESGKKKRGAPRKASIDDDVELYRAVRSRIQNGETERKAIEGAKKALKLHRESLDALDARFRRSRIRIEKGRRMWEQVDRYLDGKAAKLLQADLRRLLNSHSS